MISVSFSITFDHDNFYPESDWVDPSPGLLAKLTETENPVGAIVIRSTGQEDFLIQDELAPWIQNLCFRAISKLRDSDHVTINYFIRSGSVTLDKSDTTVRLAGTGNQSAVYPLKELAGLLIACGKRYLEVIVPLKAGDKVYAANMKEVAGFEPAATEALKSF